MYANMISFRYAKILQTWEFYQDDRRIAYNMYKQILAAENTRQQIHDAFCRAAINHAIAEQIGQIDKIIYRFTGLVWGGTGWEEG